MISRCVIDPNHRGIKMMQFLTESIAAVVSMYCGNEPGLVISDVRTSHTRFYSCYGFKSVDGIPAYPVNGLEATCLVIELSSDLSLSGYSSELKPKLKVKINEYQQTGNIKLNICKQ